MLEEKELNNDTESIPAIRDISVVAERGFKNIPPCQFKFTLTIGSFICEATVYYHSRLKISPNHGMLEHLFRASNFMACLSRYKQ